MLLTSEFLKHKFDQAQTFESFVATGEADNHRGKWDERYGRLALDEGQLGLIRGFSRTYNVLCLSGIWCGDCALQGAAMQRIAEANPDRINLRFLGRTEDHADLITRCQINAGFRVPVTWFLAEDFEPVSRFGDRTLSRYRSMARKQLSEGAVLVQAPPPVDPIATVLQEVLDEFERVHLLLRTSGRLRAKHGD